MKLKAADLKPCAAPIAGFTGHTVPIVGVVDLPMTLGMDDNIATSIVQFVVVDVESAYNGIIGRPSMIAMGVIPSLLHQMVKFPTPNGIGVMHGCQEDSRLCYVTSTRSKKAGKAPVPEGSVRGKTSHVALPIDFLDDRKDFSDHRPAPVEEVEAITLLGKEGRTASIGTKLSDEHRGELIELLRGNADIFAWSPADMPGVDPMVIAHELNVDPQARPIRQKKRSMGGEKMRAANEETARLLEAGFIREVDYPDWLANVVMVKKSSGKWRMCVDFSDLNKACPKDSFPLPRIDHLVDNASGYELLSFMDAFSGYNQIPMAPHDEERTSFITDRGTFCYKKMPFGLKNAGATYQRMVNKVFIDQIDRTLEVYIDDMLVKSKKAGDHVADLKETFAKIRQYKLRLNPEKCIFGVESGKFLGFMITKRGIEANPDKIAALINMQAPRTIRDLQRLNGCVAALGRFLSKSAERSLPFFRTLRKALAEEKEARRQICWDDPCSRAFDELKAYLQSPPLLAKPEEGEELSLYLAAAEEAVSSVLIKEEKSAQRPIYYSSRVLREAETRYSPLEKLAYCLVLTARKLRPYFQAHTIVVHTNSSLEKNLKRMEKSGRMLNWSVELSEFDIVYRPRRAIKGQALADFIVECTAEPGEATADPSMIASPSATSKVGEPDEEPMGELWKVHVDGSSTSSGAGAGIVIETPEGAILEYALRFGFKVTNNIAEYEAALNGLKLCRALGATNVLMMSDSSLVVQQVRGTFAAREDMMKLYLANIRAEMTGFQYVELRHLPRSNNLRADALSKLASSSPAELGKAIYVENLPVPSLVREKAMCAQQVATWMEPIIAYLQTGELPVDKIEARKLERRSLSYVLLDGILHRKSRARYASLPYLKCLAPTEADYVIREIHEGNCGNHYGGRTIAHQATRQGYYWPTMQADALSYVQQCKECQRFFKHSKAPPAELVPIISPVPFAKWGLDILGPFPKASRNRRFLVTAVDYFTKWIEAEPLASTTWKHMKSFVWKSIICRFGIPLSIVTDNGPQFDSEGFKEFCKKWRIQLNFASVAHPQANGLAEAANKCMLGPLKKKVGAALGTWPEELPGILWSYRTTYKVATGESPFMLAYGAEAVVPVEVGEQSVRLRYFEEAANDDGLGLNLELVEEVRDRAVDCLIKNGQKMARYYNSRVKKRSFRIGDLVLRDATFKPDHRGKLSAKWEGPYTVIDILGPSTYKLATLEGKTLKHPWNAEHLRKYYQ